MSRPLIVSVCTMPLGLLALFFASGYAYPVNRVFEGYPQLVVLLLTFVGYALTLGFQGKLYGDTLPKWAKRIADWTRVTLEFFAIMYVALASEHSTGMAYQLLGAVFLLLIALDVVRLFWVQRVALKGSRS